MKRQQYIGWNRNRFAGLMPLLMLFVAAVYAVREDKRPSEGGTLPPAVGEEARTFELPDLDGKPVKLADEVRDGPVVLIVLRGYPDAHCPLCNRQLSQFVAAAEAFRAANARVVFVYPGAKDMLRTHALELLAAKKLPANFRLLLDPDYQFTNAWHLRWNAAKESAYPSTFVIDGDQTIRFAKISRSHGGRSTVDEVLAALKPL